VFSFYQKPFLQGVFTRYIEIHGAADNADGLLLAGIIADRGVPVFGLGLIGKKSQNLNADSF